MNTTSILPATESPEDRSLYGYTPTTYVTLIFLVWFGVSTLLHVFQAIKTRTWFMLYTATLAGLGETLAWVGRLWSSYSPTSRNAFMMQITTAIMSPTPLLAAIFIISGIVITQLGPSYSRFPSKLYTIIFLTCDTIALVAQGVGGALASTQDDPTTGGNIMLGGIVFQTAVIIAYSIITIEFMWRYLKDKPIANRASVKTGRGFLYTKLKWMIAALCVCTTLLFIRAIYRIIELSEGWRGAVITTEWYFNVFDGVPVGLGITLMNVCHPGWIIHPVRDIFRPENSEFAETKKSGSGSQDSTQASVV
ncbi:RTA1-domain-containing protein [Pterulicium gracile]|uniref:RTA1-domain-containing protein n=1 Tax=Pterulicium gracile TaxID=1884261 RepID=A0A5C3Q888_9AGAR|nr:RTA1-domain-containing protein [Pterula gracilis]